MSEENGWSMAFKTGIMATALFVLMGLIMYAPCAFLSGTTSRAAMPYVFAWSSGLGWCIFFVILTRLIHDDDYRKNMMLSLYLGLPITLNAIAFYLAGIGYGAEPRFLHRFRFHSLFIVAVIAGIVWLLRRVAEPLKRLLRRCLGRIVSRAHV